MTKRNQFDWERVSVLYNQALDMPFSQVEDWLNEVCSSDEKKSGLNSYILKLVNSSVKADEFFDKLNSNIDFDLDISKEQIHFKPGDRFDKFRIIKEIGHGGMARVFLCKRDDGQFDHTVAVKLMKISGDVQLLKEKFRQEQQILAGINHPNIARLYDGGITQQGFPYMVMEYVEGEPIDQYCIKNNLGVKEKLSLFMQVCSALQYAHNKLIVHHDIKPGNILVNKDGLVKLLDFGISQVIFNQDKLISDQPAFSGTLQYAAPEQFKGAAPSVASDIYKLGLVLFNLITQEHYSHFQDKAGLTRNESTPGLLVILLKDKLSKGTSSLIISDLAAILNKSLAYDPSSRFLSVNEFYHELQNTLKDEPLHSHPPSVAYRLKKKYARNKTSFWLLVAFNVAIFVAAYFLVVQYFETLREKQRAEEILEFVWDVFDSADPETTQGDTISAFDLLEKSMDRIIELKDQSDLQAELYHITGQLFSKLGFWQRSGELFLQSLDIYEKKPKRRHDLIRADVLTDLAANYRNLSEYKKADSLSDIVLEVYRRNNAHNIQKHSEILKIKGSVKRILGEYEAGIGYLEEAINLLEKQSPKPEREIVNVRVTLASIFRDLSQYEKAMEHMGIAIAMIDELEPGLSTDKITAYNNMAVLQGHMGNYEEALATGKKTYEMNLQLYGAKNPGTLMSLSNMASQYYRLRDYKKCDSLYLLLINGFNEQLGAYHNYTVSTIYNLGNSYYSQGRFEEALIYQKKSLEADIHNFGDNHPYTGGGYYSMGLSYRGLGQYVASMQNLLKAYEIYKSSFGDEHITISRVYSNLGELYYLMGDKKNGKINFDKAIKMAEKILGPDNPVVQDFRKGLAKFI